MRIAILTNEYPPHVYGGAGVHVEYLTRELASADGGSHHISVLCFGGQDIRDGNLTVRGVRPGFRAALPGSPAQDVSADDAQRPGHGRDAQGRGHRPLPHVVHPPRRLSREATDRGEPCPDDALAGAPPPLEGRAARLRVSGEFGGSSAPLMRTPTASSPYPGRCGRTFILFMERPTTGCGSSITGST